MNPETPLEEFLDLFVKNTFEGLRMDDRIEHADSLDEAILLYTNAQAKYAAAVYNLSDAVEVLP